MPYNNIDLVCLLTKKQITQSMIVGAKQANMQH